MHHIWASCLGGPGDYIDKEGNSRFYKNSKHWNCVYLTPKEHLIAHIYYYLEHKDCYKLYMACNYILNTEIKIDEDFLEYYEKIREIEHNMPAELQEKVRVAGDFHYMPVKPNKTNRSYDNYYANEDMVKKRKEASAGKNNGMFGKGYKVAGGKNGHASIRYFYKDKVFECKNDLIDYLESIGLHITKSAIRVIVQGKGTMRVYNMYKDILDNLSWEYKA